MFTSTAALWAAVIIFGFLTGLHLFERAFVSALTTLAVGLFALSFLLH